MNDTTGLAAEVIGPEWAGAAIEGLLRRKVGDPAAATGRDVMEAAGQAAAVLSAVWPLVVERERVAAAEAVEKVRELHFPRGRNILGYPVCDACTPLQPFPCPTVAVLPPVDGDGDAR